MAQLITKISFTICWLAVASLILGSWETIRPEVMEALLPRAYSSDADAIYYAVALTLAISIVKVAIMFGPMYFIWRTKRSAGTQVDDPYTAAPGSSHRPFSPGAEHAVRARADAVQRDYEVEQKLRRERQSGRNGIPGAGESPDDLYKIVGEELTRKEIHPGPKAHAIAEAVGNKELAKSLYIKYRCQELAQQLKQNGRRTSVSSPGNEPSAVNDSRISASQQVERSESSLKTATFNDTDAQRPAVGRMTPGGILVLALFGVGFVALPLLGLVLQNTQTPVPQQHTIESVAADIARQHNADANSILDDMTVSTSAKAVGKNVVIEYVLKVEKGLPASVLAEYKSDLMKEIIPPSCALNAQNEAFEKGLQYTFVYRNTHGETLAEFVVNRAVCGARQDVLPPSVPGGGQTVID